MNEELPIDPSAGKAEAATVPGLRSGLLIEKRFMLGRSLGGGGMGVVWLARDKNLGIDRALKFVNPLMVNNPTAMEDLRKEALRTRALSHPNIVRMDDFIQGEEGGNKVGFIVMEYIDGDTLTDMKRRQPERVFQVEDIADWVWQLCAALEYAHKKCKIAHYDLKPANLMVNKKGDLKVTDFGISRNISESISRLTAASRRGGGGTMPYSSPQQMEGLLPSNLDDVYSVGATLYDLLTGKPPFHRGDIWRQAHEIIPPAMAARRKEADFNITGKPIPERWEDVVAACLAKDPSQRPQSIQEIARRLGLMEKSAVPSKSVIVRPERRKISGKLAAYHALLLAYRKPVLISVVVAVMLLLAVAGYRSYGQIIQQKVQSASASVKSWWNDGGRLIVKNLPKDTVLYLSRADDEKTMLEELTQSGKSKRHDPGAYVVRVKLQGEEIWTNKVKILGKEGVLLDLSREVGNVEVVSEPDGAEIFRDGKLVGSTPLKHLEIPIGACDVSARYRDWSEVRQSVVVKKDGMRPVRFEFAGSVKIDSEPQGAMISENGRDLGLTPHVIKNVPPGEKHYQLKLPGYLDQPITVKVASESTTTPRVILNQKPKKPGSLVLNVEPAGALLELDGKPASMDNLKHVATGPHTLKIHLDGYEPWTRGVVVREEQVENLGAVTLEHSKGDLMVRSTPADADYSLFAFGASGAPLSTAAYSGKTPGMLPKIPVGEYEVRVKRGDWEKSQKVMVKRNETTPIEITFGYGKLQVTTDPSKAIVTLGAKEKRNSPAIFDGIKPGKYPVSVELDGYESVAEEIVIGEGKRENLGPLVLLRSVAGLSVSSKTEGVEIFIDGKPSGQTPLELRLLTGDHKVTARYKEWSEDRSVKVAKGTSPAIHFEVLGGLSISSMPRGAEVIVNGNAANEKTPLTLAKLPPGKIKLEVRLTGFNSQTIESEVAPGKIAPVFVDLKQVESTRNLTIETNPGATVVVKSKGKDGAILKAFEQTKSGFYTAKISPGEIKPGFYILSISLNGYEDHIANVEVLADGPNPLKPVRLTKVGEKAVEPKPSPKAVQGRLDKPVGSSSVGTGGPDIFREKNEEKNGKSGTESNKE